MPNSSLRTVLLISLAVVAACSKSNGRTADTAATARLLVTAGINQLDPSPAARPSVAPAEVAGAPIATYYRLTTPASVPFAFDLVSWSVGAAGTSQVSIRHLRDGNSVASGDSSMIEAGILPQGNGLVRGGGWLGAFGDGFVRLSLQGRITENQLFAVAADGNEVALVEIAIGDSSPINRPESATEELPDGAVLDTIYSSDSWQFGLPTVTVSGDRASIVCYEGDQQSPTANDRYELRLQHDRATGAVTGGATALSVADTGYWRDHEVAALYNVLAVVRGEEGRVRLRLSFDRGATFAQDAVVMTGNGPSRLVQMAMAADYSLAIAAWRENATGTGVEFVLVEGRPQAFDAFGSPTWYGFDAPQVLYTAPMNSSPLVTGIAWSEGGDLAIGYAVTTFGSESGLWSSTTVNRSAVRRFGEQIVDVEVDSERIIGFDPSVAVSGQGADLKVFYAYEASDGVRLATSRDGGRTFARAATLGAPGDHQPTVMVRESAGTTRLDVLYLGTRNEGLELHRSHWSSWPNSVRMDSELTTAAVVPAEVPPNTGGVPPGGNIPMFYALRSTQLNWLGYDAVVDLGSPMASDASTTATTGVPGGGFQAAVPPPLAPGLTEPVRAVDPAHSHQLKLLRLP
ncbi:MAG: hypothetical protein MUC36_27430 [Planctomycetes bacterium]|nr:hypothetical protein [Planctomycetota bacterium]